MTQIYIYVRLVTHVRILKLCKYIMCYGNTFYINEYYIHLQFPQTCKFSEVKLYLSKTLEKSLR